MAGQFRPCETRTGRLNGVCMSDHEPAVMVATTSGLVTPSGQIGSLTASTMAKRDAIVVRVCAATGHTAPTRMLNGATLIPLFIQHTSYHEPHDVALPRRE